MAIPLHVHSLWNSRTAPRGIRTSIRLVLQDGSWCLSGKIGGESLEAGRLTSAFTCTSTAALAGHGGRVILAVGRQGNRYFGGLVLVRSSTIDGKTHVDQVTPTRIDSAYR